MLPSHWQGPDPVSPQHPASPRSRYVPPAEELMGLRGKDGASGEFAFGLQTLAVCLPEHRKAFLSQCCFWEASRGQAGLLKQATPLFVGSGVRRAATELGLFPSICSWPRGEGGKATAQEATSSSPKRQRREQSRQELLGSVSRRLSQKAAVQGPGALAEGLERSVALRGWAGAVPKATGRKSVPVASSLA